MKVRLPTDGSPMEIVATFHKSRSFLMTLISFQGTKKSFEKGPKIRIMPTRSPPGQTPKVKSERAPTRPMEPD
jgi:hypothetical protein